MVTATKPLLALTAADVMTETLVLIPQEMSLSAAARLLSQHQISGAPVVDAAGICVGVLSGMDFVHWAEHDSKARRTHDTLDREYCPSWQIMESENLPEDAVGDYMTAGPATVGPTARIAELARMMVDAHIHRLIVVDEFGHPCGIVSTTDILAALAYADPTLGQH